MGVTNIFTVRVKIAGNKRLFIVGESHYFWRQETPEEIAADYHANTF
jgi:hypothetical protein